MHVSANAVNMENGENKAAWVSGHLTSGHIPWAPGATASESGITSKLWGPYGSANIVTMLQAGRIENRGSIPGMDERCSLATVWRQPDAHPVCYP
jgi:hypothetical protein